MFNTNITCQSPQEQPDCTAILASLDLVEFEAAHHWEQYEQATLEAQRRLALYDAAMQDREELAKAVSSALAEAEAILR